MKRSKHNEASLTIMEVLVVLGILVILTSLLVSNLGSSDGRPRMKVTEALLLRIKVALQMYSAEFRDLPPDSFDPEGDKGYAYKDGGVVLGEPGAEGVYKNTGSLVYFLCQPLKKTVNLGVGGGGDIQDQHTSVVGPFLTDLKASYYSIEGFKVSDLGVKLGASKVEILDSFGRPLEYDKVSTLPSHFSGSRFDNEPFSVAGSHWSETGSVAWVNGGDESDCGVVEDLNKVFDPRRMAGASGCLDRGMKPVPRNVGTFDLWSHGPLWSSPEDDIFAK
ncbi:MAG: type II secretion system protein [Planctomycetota bacterium]|nr:type II secretion system protein [Planctomycetota bacterium]